MINTAVLNTLHNRTDRAQHALSFNATGEKYVLKPLANASIEATSIYILGTLSLHQHPFGGGRQDSPPAQ